MKRLFEAIICIARIVLCGWLLGCFEHSGPDIFTPQSFILHRREAGEHQDLLRILTQEHTQNQEIVDMADSIVELSEQRGEQRGIQQGIEQGSRRTSIESTLAILNTRFPEAAADTLTPALETIEDLNRLKRLNLEASLVESFRAFQERLGVATCIPTEPERQECTG